MELMIGKPAPGFTLYDSEKNKISLADLKGKNVLLLFFPQAFTSTCTKELCDVRDDIARYQHADAAVIGLSVDSVFTLKKYKEEQGFNFPLLSDFNKEVSKAYNSLYVEWILDMKGVSKRSAIIVDKEGILRYMEILENAGDIPNFNDINAKLEELSR
jgi:glutaredoxin-dependent peroxiredoxin